MMHHHVQFLAAIAIVAGIISISAIATTTQAQLPSGTAPFEINSAISEDRIVITIVKSSAAEELPDTPIVIIPPNETAGEENATVITPGEPTQLPVIPGEPAPPANITIIEPDGNVTQVPAGNITETPGNVTVIDPPAPEPCGCPPAEEPPTAVQLPVMPAGGGNDTTIISNETTIETPPPVITQLPATQEEESDDGNGDGNGNGDDGGG
jgi:hypothetical protein